MLSVRFEAGRQLYNAALGEALRRLDRLKQAQAWHAARTMPCATPAERNARAAEFSRLTKAVGLTESDIQSYVTQCKNACWIGEHLDAHTTQKIGTRAWKAVQRDQFRTGGRPRFKPKWKALDSMDGKSNATAIRWRGDHVEWGGVHLAVMFDRKDTHGVQSMALQHPVKYCRIVRRVLRGTTRWAVQLVLAGAPKWKDNHPVRAGTCSIDIGPSTIAAVGETEAVLEPLCGSVPALHQAIRRIQRALDRSRRRSNPDNYHADGTSKTPKPGERLHWVFTKGYLRLRVRLADLHRRLAACRKAEHGRLAHRIIAMGRTVLAEKLSYKAFQRKFGTSVRDRAPGMFMDRLRRKAARAGGAVIEFPTRTTKRSQRCHCGAVVKKPLSQRWHQCACGVRAQRDLYSAYLGLHVRKDGGTWVLDTESARTGWCAAEPLLENAVSRVVQAANGGPVPASFGLRAGDRAARSRRRQPVLGGEFGCCSLVAAATMVRAEQTSGARARTPRL
ncbi:zinc ribbon domain-containing protein [Nitrospira sp. Kam-Ns4a]